MDELTIMKEKEEYLTNYEEGEITFLPTYKFGKNFKIIKILVLIIMILQKNKELHPGVIVFW